MIAINAATSPYSAVCALPHAPSPAGARTGMCSARRQTKMPTTAMNAATTAVPRAPAQNWAESARTRFAAASRGGARWVIACSSHS